MKSEENFHTIKSNKSKQINSKSAKSHNNTLILSNFQVLFRFFGLPQSLVPEEKLTRVMSYHKTFFCISSMTIGFVRDFGIAQDRMHVLKLMLPYF